MDRCFTHTHSHAQSSWASCNVALDVWCYFSHRFGSMKSLQRLVRIADAFPASSTILLDRHGINVTQLRTVLCTISVLLLQRMDEISSPPIGTGLAICMLLC